MPGCFTVVNDLVSLLPSNSKQYRCSSCHQLKAKAKRAEHQKHCAGGLLLSQLLARFGITAAAAKHFGKDRATLNQYRNKVIGLTMRTDNTNELLGPRE